MECYTSRWKLIGLLTLTSVMVGASAFCTTQVGLVAKIFGWFGVGFFSLGFVAFPMLFFRTGPQVVINEAGLDDRRWKLGVIPWEDIQSLSIFVVQSNKLLAIELVDPDKYLARLPRHSRWLASVNQSLGLPSFAISFAGLSPGINQVWAELQAKIPTPPVSDVDPDHP